MEKEKTIDHKYVQQHLANERTFLAWIRTSVTIIGLGFLAAGVVFRSTNYEQVGHDVAAAVGILSLTLGSVIMVLATRDYFVKLKGINEETFLAPKVIIFAVLAFLGIIYFLLFVLALIILLY